MILENECEICRGLYHQAIGIVDDSTICFIEKNISKLLEQGFKIGQNCWKTDKIKKEKQVVSIIGYCPKTNIIFCKNSDHNIVIIKEINCIVPISDFIL